MTYAKLLGRGRGSAGVFGSVGDTFKAQLAGSTYTRPASPCMKASTCDAIYQTNCGRCYYYNIVISIDCRSSWLLCRPLSSGNASRVRESETFVPHGNLLPPHGLPSLVLDTLELAAATDRLSGG